MISVIIPTMWKHDEFRKTLSNILIDTLVSEVIIINNDVNNKPDYKILSHDKIKIYDFQENIYVNPAWNFGVEKAKNNILAFISDDVEFDTRVFRKVYDLISSTENIGFIGVLTRYLHEYGEIYDRHFTDGSIEIIDNFPTSTFGALFFMTKESWKPIPNDLKIVNGECLQINRCYHLQKKNFMVVNCRSTSPWHVTLKTMPQSMIDKDNALFEKINNDGVWTQT
jgi:GT2 family glycosyltransferase